MANDYNRYNDKHGDKNSDKQQKKEEFKDAAKGAAQGAKDKAHEAQEQLAERAGEAKNKVQAQINEAKKEAGARAERGFEQGKGQVVTQISSVAQAFRKTSEQLRSEDQNDLAGYTERIADQVERVSNYIEGKGLRGVAGDLETLARQRPGLFVGGALVLGLVAARFLRSGSSDASRS